MKRAFISICMITVLSLALCGSAMAGKFKVTKVYDGDTIMAEGHDIVTYVLLAGIDAPEISAPSQEPGHPYEQAANP